MIVSTVEAFQSIFARPLAGGLARVSVSIANATGGSASGIVADVAVATLENAQVVCTSEARVLVVGPGEHDLPERRARFGRARERAEAQLVRTEQAPLPFDLFPPDEVIGDGVGQLADAPAQALEELCATLDVVQSHGRFDLLQRQIAHLGRPESRTIGGLLNAHLRDALARRDPFRRDAFANVLARALGSDALPALLDAATHDLGDDQDSLIGSVDSLMTASSQACRPHAVAFASRNDEAHRLQGLRALTLLPPARDAAFTLLCEALTDQSPTLRAQTATLVHHSPWAGLTEIQRLLRAAAIDRPHESAK